MLDQSIDTEFHLRLDEFSRPSQRLRLIVLAVADVARSASSAGSARRQGTRVL